MTARAYMTVSFAAVLAVLLPVLAGAQLNQGIYGCNETSAYAMSVGTMKSLGGTFVPVFDSAVTLNTGYLVYDACVLRPLVDSFRQAATSRYIQTTLGTFNTSRNGNPQFPQNFNYEQFQAGDKAANAVFPTIVGQLNSAFQGPVQTALARNYALTTKAPQNELACPYQGNLNNLKNDSPYTALFTAANPACDPVYAYYMAQDQLNANVAAAQDSWRTQLNWGQGIYPVIDPQTGLVITPGIMVGAVATQALTSGYRQLESANDIGQMVQPLLSAVGQQILSNVSPTTGLVSGGLAGINVPQGNSPSFLSQVVTQTSNGLSQSVSATLLSNLISALNTETQYNQYLSGPNGMASDLTQAITNIRGAENTCWALVASSTCASAITYSASGAATCQGTNGATLHIATSTPGSTDFAQQVVGPSTTLGILGAQVAQKAAAVTQTIATISGFIAGLQSSDPATVQTAQQGATTFLQTFQPDDPSQASQSASDLHAQLFNQPGQQPVGLLAQTFQQWAGDAVDTNPSSPTYGQTVNGVIAWSGSGPTGWCNASPTTTGGPATIALWQKAWQ